MNVNNNLQGLQQLFPGQEVGKAEGGNRATAAAAGPQAAADQATLSAAASLAASAAPDSDVRMEKVLAVQKALADGTYNVPASDVAGKLIDQMLGK